MSVTILLKAFQNKVHFVNGKLNIFDPMFHHFISQFLEISET